MRYTACLDVERQARQAVTAAEKRRDDISKSIGLLISIIIASPHRLFLVGVLLSQNQPVIGIYLLNLCSPWRNY